MISPISAQPPVAAIPEATRRRWQPLRAGLQNVWQYDHATRFVFHRGRLLLRGRNGSGKTKAVELLLPFLLEGRLDPRRLDPFGNQSRRMHYNLLHPANADLQINVGYVWLELGMRTEQGPRYVTIGAGLKARRTSEDVESWFFVVHDRRVDVDLDLLDETRRPLSRSALETLLGTSGRVFPQARDYRAAVNRELFALDPQQYEALLEALLRLRQPHLSERLDPSQVGAVLSQSLPPLDGERVREVSEGFERLENHRRELADRRQTLDSVRTFLGDYRTYVTTVGAVRATALTRADRRARDASSAVNKAKEAWDSAVGSQGALDARRTEVERELGTTKVRIRAIETSDEYRAIQQLEEAEGQASAAEDRALRLRERAVESVRAVADTEGRRERADRSAAEQSEVVRQAAQAVRREAVSADLGDVQAVLARGVEEPDESAVRAARGTVVVTARARREAIESLRRHERAVAEAAEGERREVERLQDAEEALRDAVTQAEEAERTLRRGLDAHRDAVEAWAGGVEVLDVDAEDLAAIVDVAPEEAASRARERAVRTRERLDVEGVAAEMAVAESERRMADVRAERDALAAATHRPPDVPAWREADRTGRAGAPLYLLLEFTEALEPESQAGIEAALDAAGILDAWVTPEGRLLGAGTLDAALVPGRRAPGRTLADVTRPTPCGDVPADVVGAVASSLSVLGEGHATTPEDGPWVASDGRFRLGPLHGNARPGAVRYIGETARAEARMRRLAELDASLDLAEREALAATERRAACGDRRRAMDAELARFPPADAVAQARAALAVASQQRGQASAEADRRRAVRANVAALVRRAQAARDAAALEAGLVAHLGALDDLAAATGAWELRCGEWFGALAVLLERRAGLAERVRERDEAESRGRRAQSDAEGGERELLETAERARALREVIGSSADAVRARLGQARAAERGLEDEQRRLDLELRAVAERVGATRQAHADAGRELERLEAVREQAALDFRALLGLGVLDHLLEGGAGEAAAGTAAATLAHARAVAKAHTAVPDDEDGVKRLLEAAMNTMSHRQQDLHRGLTAGVRLFPRMEHGVLVHDVQYLGKTHRLPGLVSELEEDVAEREARLARGEQELLESFLAGELHEHLRSRIRDAAALVGRMNRLLADCPTTAGQRLRLDWRVGEDAPAGTAQAVDLLLRGSGLLTTDHRAQLRTWLHERLREAREGEAAASLEERIAGAFDYRRWHAFGVEFRDAASPTWRRLTRLTHGTGSGGEKAVMLHLPLFAAMAAHYEASELAPRLIVLDEVFAGIDRGTRGQLMRLLVQLDLDALLTSHDEWGFYAELDGISTYQLMRDAEMPGVLAEWFVWDGATRWSCPPGGARAAAVPS